MAATGELTIDTEAGERLDRVMQAAVPECSRTVIQRLIEDGHVKVDGKAARPGHKLRRGERIMWEIPAPEPVTGIHAEVIPLDIRFEDAELIVLNKPRGLVVHPAPGHQSGTLVNAVLAHAGEELSGIGGVERPGIVHRLDKDTSGLMLVAKTERAYRSLQSQIAERRVERRYLALVAGTPRFERASVDAPIGRNPGDRKKMGVIRPGSERTHREAVTELRVLARFPGLTLLEARLQTGRTHQIRVHCGYIKLPVVGDELYGARNLDRDPHLPPEVRAAIGALEGQALHAYRLAFDHPVSGERLCRLSEPPPDFRRLLDALGSTWDLDSESAWPETDQP